jgi:hypothetical protein
MGWAAGVLNSPAYPLTLVSKARTSIEPSTFRWGKTLSSPQPSGARRAPRAFPQAPPGLGLGGVSPHRPAEGWNWPVGPVAKNDHFPRLGSPFWRPEGPFWQKTGVFGRLASPPFLGAVPLRRPPLPPFGAGAALRLTGASLDGAGAEFPSAGAPFRRGATPPFRAGAPLAFSGAPPEETGAALGATGGPLDEMGAALEATGAAPDKMGAALEMMIFKPAAKVNPLCSTRAGRIAKPNPGGDS